jgi:hypothetical protein
MLFFLLNEMETCRLSPFDQQAADGLSDDTVYPALTVKKSFPDMSLDSGKVQQLIDRSASTQALWNHRLQQITLFFRVMTWFDHQLGKAKNTLTAVSVNSAARSEKLT